MEASKNCLQLAQKDGANGAKVDALTEIKEKTKNKYIEAIHSFNDNVGPTYIAVSVISVSSRNKII